MACFSLSPIWGWTERGHKTASVTAAAYVSCWRSERGGDSAGNISSFMYCHFPCHYCNLAFGPSGGWEQRSTCLLSACHRNFKLSSDLLTWETSSFPWQSYTSSRVGWWHADLDLLDERWITKPCMHREISLRFIKLFHWHLQLQVPNKGKARRSSLNARLCAWRAAKMATKGNGGGPLGWPT